MFRWLIVSGLVVLNGLLGVGVYSRLVERTATAQIGAPKVEIATVSGVNNGISVVYMLDVNSGSLVSYRLDIANKQIRPLAQKNVAADLARIP